MELDRYGLPRCSYDARELLPCDWCHDGCAYFHVQTMPSPACGTQGLVPCMACKGECVYAARRKDIDAARREGTWWDGQPYADVYWEDPWGGGGGGDASTIVEPEPVVETIQLDCEQTEAVDHVDGPILVVAGAGSGKTRVLTQRIVRLMRKGISAPQILAVTFTRKAASEMRARIAAEVGTEIARKLTVCTFHSLALGICRENPEAVGRENGFSIWDDKVMASELKRILKEAWEEDGLPGKPPGAGDILETVGRRKRLAAEVVCEEYLYWLSESYHPVVAHAVEEYEEIKRLANAMDYDDLIWSVVRALLADPDLLATYTERWHYLLVDEYQDTNDLQEKLIALLAGDRKNLMVVGDEDQAIYAFRGSNPHHILSFEQRYEGARIVELGKNYRSSDHVLSSAARVIANNIARRPKNLRTDNDPGWKVEYVRQSDAYAEARYIARMIGGSIEAGYPPDEHAILVRTRRQLTTLQMGLSEMGITYSTVGAIDFWQRADVRLILAWLKSYLNPRDFAAGALMLSHWPRLGAKTVKTWKDLAIRFDQHPMWFVLTRLHHERGCGEHTVRGQSIAAFRDAVEEMDLRARRGDSVQELVLWIYEVTGLADEIKEGMDGTGREAEEARNRDALRHHVVGMCPTEHGGNAQVRVESFLDAALTNAVKEEEIARVVLSTIHSAKGLEWDHVWVAGCIEGLLPYSPWFDGELVQLSPDELEEERRLAYVAMTRARKRLVLTHFPVVIVEGQPKLVKPSRFLVESVNRLDDGLEVPTRASAGRTGVISL